MIKSNFERSPIHYSTHTSIFKELYLAMSENLSSSIEPDDDLVFSQINDYMKSVIKEEINLSGVVTIYHVWEKHVVEYFQIKSTPADIGLVYHVKSKIQQLSEIGDIFNDMLNEINRYRLIVNFRKHGSGKSATQLLEKYSGTISLSTNNEYELNMLNISFEKLSDIIAEFWEKVDQFACYNFSENLNDD